MKAKDIIIMMLCATVSLQAQSRKERRKEELELLREMKQEEDEEKEEALKEAQKKIMISRFKLIFDVLNVDLLIKLSSEVVFCMEKHGYNLREVRFYEHMDDLKKYAPNTPLNKMPEVSLSKQVELHFDKEISIRVGFSYNDDDGDNKYIQLLSGNNDFDKKIKEFQTLKALEPFGKFKLSALDYREEDESKVSKESRYIGLVYDYIDINKVVFEAKTNALVEAEVLGKKLADDAVNHNTNGQNKDIIVKLDKSQIEAKVVEISETTIKYRKYQNLEGPIYSINVSDVSHIVFTNGSTEYYSGKKTETEKKAVLGTENEKTAPKTNQIPRYNPKQ
jgi:hypothetical protein